jgi:RNA polymerase-binding transcription factor DksA
MPAVTKTPISVRKSTLLGQRDALLAKLSAIETELSSQLDPDWEDRAIQREDEDVLQAAGQSGQLALRQIEAALTRIDTAQYGQCLACGSDIEEARLDVLPAAPLCSACATKGEAR